MRAWIPALVATAGCLVAVGLLFFGPDPLPPDDTPRDAGALPAVLAPAPVPASSSPPAGPPDAGFLPDAPFNPGFIGAACEDDLDCPYAGGICLRPSQGWAGGTCSKVCTGTCPQKTGDYYSGALCVPDPSGLPRGVCAARCALNLTPTGCRPGYTCTMARALHGGPASERFTCVPDLGTPAPPTACTRELTSRGLAFGRPDLADDSTHLGGALRTCQLDTPVWLSSPIHHVDWREYGRRMAENLLVSCDMALALEGLSALLATLDVVEVEHVGTYNCRGVAGSSRLSAHATGRAIDIRAFERAGLPPVSVAAHWNGTDPERRRWLRTLVSKLRKTSAFSKVYGPDTDVSHQDHLHLELSVPAHSRMP